MFWSTFKRVIFLVLPQECLNFAQIWKEWQNQNDIDIIQNGNVLSKSTKVSQSD